MELIELKIGLMKWSEIEFRNPLAFEQRSGVSSINKHDEQLATLPIEFNVVVCQFEYWYEVLKETPKSLSVT